MYNTDHICCYIGLYSITKMYMGYAKHIGSLWVENP
jgi:hypothetical protein